MQSVVQERLDLDFFGEGNVFDPGGGAFGRLRLTVTEPQLQAQRLQRREPRGLRVGLHERDGGLI